MTYEQQFLGALKSIFIGAKVEGDSGYINLMKIKANYFEKGVFPVLMKDIDAACKPFEKGFREELFDKLYDFFQHYFSESGSIYFRNTAQHHNIYEKVYTDDRDVMLFWKTHMLYYVKTDRLFNSMEIEVDGEKFFFDVSGMELKRSNEKRELTYTFKSIKNGVITLTVGYSEKGRKTKIDEIVKAAKDKGMTLDEETLEKTFAVFQKQSEVDYFINKNAKGFLQEQFDLWMYQYIFKGESEFNELRLKQLQAMKGIATKIIDFIAQFEDELVKVWNKPKFALNSNYIITLDHVIARSALSATKQSPDGKGIASGKEQDRPRNDILAKIFKHKGMKDQIAEWVELGMVDKKFKLDLVLEKNLLKEPANPQYQYLPLDTKYIKDLELDILALFDDLDSALDGWLIHSENYQALNTLLPKFREQISYIYIDPPYNAATSEILYVNTYKHSTFATMMENRLDISKRFLQEKFTYTVAIDEVEQRYLGDILTQQIFPDNQVICVTVIHNRRGQQGKNFSSVHEYAYFIYPDDKNKYIADREFDEVDHRNLRDSGTESSRNDAKNCFYPIIVQDGKVLGFGDVPNDDFHPNNINLKKKDGTICVYPIDTNGNERKWRYARQSVEGIWKDLEVVETKKGIQIYFNKSLGTVKTVWQSEKYDASEQGTKVLQDLFTDSITDDFTYPKSLNLVEDCVKSASSISSDGIVFDYFGGSGTTAHAVMNLNRADGGKRKYILVEMGEHFNTVILPRVKKVAFSDKWKNGEAQAGKGISHFAKYFELEQYEDALKKARYEDAPLFAGTQDAYTSYAFLRDLKMLEAVKMDKKKNKVEINLDKLYDGIDLAETLSCLTGKWIKRITKDSVEFQDGTSASLSAPDWDDVKPLIWW